MTQEHHDSSDGYPPGFPPCPGCGEPGFSVQVWVGEGLTQLWQCGDEDCRAQEYKPRDCDPQEDSGSIGL